MQVTPHTPHTPHLSRRFHDPAQPNAIARTHARLTAAGVDLVDLTDSNPTHFALGSPEVLDVVARATRRAAAYAPDPRGPLLAREALAARWGGSPEEYWLTASTSEAYSWVVTALCDADDAVAIPIPGYPLIEPLVRLAGARVVPAPWHYVHPHGWIADTSMWPALAARPDVAAFVLVNPGNPTGAYVDAATRDAAVAACAAGGAALIADEVFGPFALDGPPTSLMGEDRVVTFAFGGLSKLLAAPQLKLAWLRLTGPRSAVAPIAAALDEIADAFLSVSTPIAQALPDLLPMSDAVATHIRERLHTNLVTLREILGDAPYRVRRCDGGWSAIVDVPRYLSDDTLVIRLMEDAHLAVHPGWFYDLPDDGALVLSLLPPPAAFTERCHRLRAAVDALAV
jgi:aspartate/methionine/tyrosine aminotransferase